MLITASYKKKLSILILVNKDSFSHFTDQELLDRFYDNHNNDWLGILLERYILLLFGVCMKYLKNEDEAKDSVQQIFLKAITELHKYKVSYFRSWIYTVARNHCLMHLRDRQGKIPAPIDENLAASDEDSDQFNQLEKDQLLELMTNSLSELNQEQNQCLILFYLEKKSYLEITENTGFTMMQVKSHIQNGKRNLKILLDKKINKTHKH
ncbi:MAG: sigma-70 family RNA polymerase sigma factor [Bacteroidetes bacterium]|nr:sigma-70 family RNA polymerase sigma factor [Bacteroidota bacterium]